MSRSGRKQDAVAEPEVEELTTTPNSPPQADTLSPPGAPFAAGASADETADETADAFDKVSNTPFLLLNKSPYKKNKGAQKRKAWTLAEKKEVCRRFRDSEITSQSKFLRELNKERPDDDAISSSNFHKWWRDCQRGAIRLDELSTQTDDNVKRRRGAKFVTVEMRLAEFCEEYERTRGAGDPPLTGPAMLRKAKEFADEVGDASFQGSKGWLWNFRRRNGLQKYLTQVDAQKEEELERVVTPLQVRDALSTLSAFAAQSGDQGLAVDVARLHQKLARLQHISRS